MNAHQRRLKKRTSTRKLKDAIAKLVTIVTNQTCIDPKWTPEIATQSESRIRRRGFHVPEIFYFDLEADAVKEGRMVQILASKKRPDSPNQKYTLDFNRMTLTEPKEQHHDNTD